MPKVMPEPASAVRFPGWSCDLVPAMLPKVITDGEPRIEDRRGLMDCRKHRQLSKRPWLGPQEFRLEDVEETLAKQESPNNPSLS
ncbi:hypothetical protein [Azospirillum sp. Sh1]|uniref:hypothetical protein n=1 Tax=Azospirillum sp. Sh1 TaxID=2607285 RepID=UPI0011EC904F|nr:hypothetical protein [Azospirillum sp. Sh1]KAA0578692.1 hypothetical protein FZ029_08920 [Azospirillum sp. Sh1]